MRRVPSPSRSPRGTTPTTPSAIPCSTSSTSSLPPMIVVGIHNTDRGRDFTPPARDGWNPPPEVGASGGADRFLRFLGDELAPWVERRYRTAPMRVLVGHSLGGLFALHALVRRPDLFTGYVVMEPSTWWNGGRDLADAVAALGTPATRNARVMLVNTEPTTVDTTASGGDRAMVRTLRIAGETHTSMALTGMIGGLRAMFADFRAPQWVPGTPPRQMLTHYDSLSRRLGFTVPIPTAVLQEVVLMSIGARRFDDAEAVLAQMEGGRGPNDGTRDFRQMLAEERAHPAPAGLVPLVIPAHRPSPREAAGFLGRWTLAGPGTGHEVEIRAAGDTLVIHERVQFSNGEWDEDDVPVIGVDPHGDLEWGQRVFRGIAALLVLHGHLEADGTMTVTRQVRGWVPRGPIGDMLRTERLRKEPR
ncbi:MAG TPA: alpha/beta hydrolase-fold protein [Gemmatimonadales bacterium]|nr:alpha/beta hydrolase-fold protein [Gemmatimonadales bacterium]